MPKSTAKKNEEKLKAYLLKHNKLVIDPPAQSKTTKQLQSIKPHG